MNKRILCLVVVIFLLFAGCVSETRESNKTVEFTDFLIERCVRKELDKDWDEEITKKDLSTITSLCITSMYDPTFAYDLYGATGSYTYSGYIDLSDLKHLENLEELKLDTFGGVDSIVNMDTIAECKNLKKISIPWANGIPETSVNPIGYKYWKDIISNLPKLEYLDLGNYFDEHMLDVVLSETDNKNIEFYFGEKGDWGYDFTSYFYQTYPSVYLCNNINLIRPEDMQEKENYESSWDYEYKTIMEKKESWAGLGYQSVFPAIYADDMDELKNELDKISKKAEDIIIVYNADDELDFSVFDKFTNLVTLSVFCTKFERKGYYDSSNYMYIYEDWSGTEPVNLDSLSNCDNLQVLNLSGFVGALSDVKNIENLRELSIFYSAPDSVDFIEDLKSVKELALNLYSNEDDGNLFIDIDEKVTKLDKLKFYRDNNWSNSYDISLYENIKEMKSLETLIIHNSRDLCNIVQSETIKNLLVSSYKEIGNISFEKMKNLEVVFLLGNMGESSIDYDSIVELPNIKSVIYDNGVAAIVEDVLTYDLAKKITSNENISAFRCTIVADYTGIYYRNADRDYIKELYEAGVDDGIFQRFRTGIESARKELTFDDFIYAFGD